MTNEKARKDAFPVPSPFQPLLSVPESHRIGRFDKTVRGLQTCVCYRRAGISPCPEGNLDFAEKVSRNDIFCPDPIWHPGANACSFFSVYFCVIQKKCVRFKNDSFFRLVQGDVLKISKNFGSSKSRILLILFIGCLISAACLAQKTVGISSTDGSSNSQMTIYNDPGKDSKGRQKGFSPRDLFGPAPTKSTTPPKKNESTNYHIEFETEGEGLEGVSMENLRFIPDDAPAKNTSRKTNFNSPGRVSKSKPVSRKVNRNTAPKKVVQKKKKEMTEDEFRKSIGMEPRTETEKLVESVAKGLLVLTSLGLLGYALLPSSAAATVEAAKVAATAKAAGAASEAGAFPASETALNEADVGEFTEEDVQLPEAPNKGDRRSYTDANGTRWTEVFDGQNWIDDKSYNKAVEQVADNEAWHNEQRVRQLNHQTEFDRGLEQRKADLKNRLEEIHSRNRAEIRANSKLILETDEMLQSMADRALERVERVNQVLDTGKTLVDVTLPIAGAFAGPPGWVVGTGYTMLSETGAGAGAAIADPSKSILKESLKGAAKGAVNVIVAEGLNSAMAVGSRVLRAGANMIPTGSTFKVSYSQTAFNAPVPVKELGQMFENTVARRGLTQNVNSDMAFSTLKEVGKSFVGGGKGLLSEAGSKLAQESGAKLAEGALASARGNLVDSGIGGFVNDSLWGKG